MQIKEICNHSSAVFMLQALVKELMPGKAWHQVVNLIKIKKYLLIFLILLIRYLVLQLFLKFLGQLEL